MKLPPRTIQPNFASDLQAAGLAGLPFSWGQSDSDLNLEDPRLSDAQRNAILGVALRDTNVPAPPGSSREDQLRFLAMKDAMPGSVGGVSGGNTGEASAAAGKAGPSTGPDGFSLPSMPGLNMDTLGNVGNALLGLGQFGLGAASFPLGIPSMIAGGKQMYSAGKSLFGGTPSDSGIPAESAQDILSMQNDPTLAAAEGFGPNTGVASTITNTGIAGVSPSSAPGLPGSQTATVSQTARGDQGPPPSTTTAPDGPDGPSGPPGPGPGGTAGPDGAPAGTGGTTGGPDGSPGDSSGDEARGGSIPRRTKYGRGATGAFKGAKKFSAGGPVSERQARRQRIQDFEAKHGKVAI